MYIYLSVRNALPMIPLSQVKVSYYNVPRIYRPPLNISLVTSVKAR